MLAVGDDAVAATRSRLAIGAAATVGAGVHAVIAGLAVLRFRDAITAAWAEHATGGALVVAAAVRAVRRTPRLGRPCRHRSR